MTVTDDCHKAACEVANKLILEIDTLQGEGTATTVDASRFYQCFMDGVRYQAEIASRELAAGQLEPTAASGPDRRG